MTKTVQYCKFVDRNGVLKPSVRQASQLVFDYKADALGMCILIYSCIVLSLDGLILIQFGEYRGYSAAVKSKIVHFVIKAPNLVYRYFKSCLLISEWVPPKI